MKSISKTIRTVQKNTKQRKVWVVTRCDDDPELIGTVLDCGNPGRAEDYPIGSEYHTEIFIPET